MNRCIKCNGLDKLNNGECFNCYSFITNESLDKFKKKQNYQDMINKIDSYNSLGYVGNNRYVLFGRPSSGTN